MSLSWESVSFYDQGECGLPHQCEHWFAMTFQAAPLPLHHFPAVRPDGHDVVAVGHVDDPLEPLLHAEGMAGLREVAVVHHDGVEPVAWGDKSNLKDVDGKELEAKNSVVYQAIEDSRLKFLTKTMSRLRRLNRDMPMQPEILWKRII